MRIKGFQGVKLGRGSARRHMQGYIRLRVDLDAASGKLAEIYTFPEKLAERVSTWLRAHLARRFPGLHLDGSIKSGLKVRANYQLD